MNQLLGAARCGAAVIVLAACGGAAMGALAQAAPTRRLVRAGDMYRLRTVGDPQRSSDGRWVAYTVSQADSAADESVTHIWMTSWDGSQTVQLTQGQDDEHTPRWSPDGRFLAFLSSRRDSSHAAQLWLLDRRGGEAARATRVAGSVEDLAWSPDGRRIALVISSEAADATDSAFADSAAQAHAAGRPRPIVVDRYAFKDDGAGYLGRERQHLYLFDMTAHTMRILTPGRYDEGNPAWSPDGRRIAFSSKRSPADPDRAINWDVFVMDALPGAPARQLTTSSGPDNSLDTDPVAWSPDGRRIAYVHGFADPRLYAYEQDRLAVVDADGGAPRELATTMDRSVSRPQWSADGRTITVLVEDDRSVYPARVDAATGDWSRQLPGRLVVRSMSLGPDGALTALVSTDTMPAEVYAIDGNTLRRLTHQNDAWTDSVRLLPAEDFTSRSRDGTEVHGLLTKPAGWAAGRPSPALLRIHGGPDGQDAHEFQFERQLFAANGYLVIAANYRGSAGRGTSYQRAIMADWGHKEVIDLLGAVDHAVRAGLADPARLGIGGWSYGGILTDYTIASDQRFKAATSGAGSALQLSMYGVDEYIVQYAAELGDPWRHADLWIRLSYPFFHADRITTPTLYLGGDRDFNVPLVGSEQMYQALRSLGVPAELVVYPGQHHRIARPSFQVDRLQRYLAWYAKYIPAESTATRGAGDATPVRSGTP